MSSTSNTKFQVIFENALKDYTNKTGKDLLNHPLASKLDSCDSPDSILDIFREQAGQFDEFRKGDTELFKWLKPVVKVLHTISTNDVLGHSASSVNLTTFFIHHDHSCH
jgi:fungal STAND N-terminal Goodbye domain